tara:strand:+ start:218 stop:451 length:234 start_codon:yes stop_codon:yes gene_type:complete
MDVEENLKEIFFQTFPTYKKSDFNWDLSQNNMKEWDSFGQLNLITLTESKFNIQFSIDETISIQSLKFLLKLIKEKI